MKKLNMEQVHERIIREIQVGEELTIVDAKNELMWEKINEIVEWIQRYEEEQKCLGELAAIKETIND